MPATEPTSASWREIAFAIERRIGAPFRIERRRAVSGGCINGATLVEGCGQRFFIKFNAAARAAMFEAEADALTRLAIAGAIRVPRPIGTGIAEDHAWLALEFLEFGPAPRDWARFGRELAAQHQVCCERFGWNRNNSIGSTAQVNDWTQDWVEFLRSQRLGYQLNLAAANGYRGKLQARGSALLAILDRFFDNYAPAASLLHGDLWSGNTGFMADGQPVVFDPAPYYGDRETDLAMTELFGGFATEFYRSYESALPLDPGYGRRKHIYMLYHLLNHLNLFGAGYLQQCEVALDALLS